MCLITTATARWQSSAWLIIEMCQTLSSFFRGFTIHNYDYFNPVLAQNSLHYFTHNRSSHFRQLSKGDDLWPHIVQADVGQVARALQVLVFEMTAQQNDECVSGSSSSVWGNPQDVQVMNDLISDPGQKRPSLAPWNSLAVTLEQILCTIFLLPTLRLA